MPDDTKVECYAGHRGEQSPRAVRTPAGRVLVAEILEQWIEMPQGGGSALRVFQVRLDTGGVVVLVLEESTGRWSVREEGHVNR